MTMTRRVAGLCLALLASGCGGEAQQSCETGSEREDGACLTTKNLDFALDGFAAEWDEARFPDRGGCLAEECGSQDIHRVHASRQDGAVLLYLDTQVAPAETDFTFYVLQLFDEGLDRRDPRQKIVTVFAGRQEAFLFQNYFLLEDANFGAAFGPTGVEFQLPTSLLPFDGDAEIEASVWQLDGDQLNQLTDPRGVTELCWTKKAEETACTAN